MNEPTAPDQASELAYYAEAGYTPAGLEAADAVDAVDAAYEIARQQSLAAQDAWNHVWRAATVAAAQALAARKWNIKKEALAIKAQANGRRQSLTAVIMGAVPVPARYEALAAAGRNLTDAEVRDALDALRADEAEREFAKARARNRNR